MPGRSEKKILIFSAAESAFTTLRRILGMPARYAPSGARAEQLLASEHFDAAIFYTPLTDEFGVQSAVSIASRRGIAVLLLVKADIYEQAVHQTAGSGVMVLSKRADPSFFSQAVRMACETSERLAQVRQENERLRRRLDGLETGSRAKGLPIEHASMSEEEAHAWIGKRAMDNGSTRREVAEKVIRKYAKA